MTVTEKGQRAETEAEQEREINQLTDTGEWNEEVKERRVSVLCSSAETEKDRNERARKSLSRRERATRAKCLKWITVGQTSEEDKTANMSHCSLLVFNNRCLVSLSPVMFPRPGCSDLVNK